MLIDRQAVIDLWDKYHYTIAVDAMRYDAELRQLPPAQPEQSIPISWIEKHIEHIKEADNVFATLTAMNISTMVKQWREEQYG